MVERMPAVDAAAPDFAAPGYAPHSWRDRWELKRSEQAVFESHRKAWQRIVDSDDAQGIVCEDDILVSEEMPKFLKRLDSDRFGVVKLDGFGAHRRYGAETGMNGWVVWEIVEAVPSAACYALSKSAAQRLLVDSATYCETLDDFLFRSRAGLCPVQLSPGVAVQRMCCEAPAVPTGPASLREQRDPGRTAKGPPLYRARKEFKRFLNSWRLRAMTRRRPALAADLPPYRDG
ncbi:glycosyltransferase family 25 protein [Rhodobacteraceae bacterium F11138]|nr:glycosyltransferase family 25 protein [Rhodobacteraceae bacterium F11138]